MLKLAQREGTFPQEDPAAVISGQPRPIWWFYKDLLRTDLGLKGLSSPADKVFACPDDRGYEDRKPFRSLAKFNYGSYVFNGVNLPGVPNIAELRELGVARVSVGPGLARAVMAQIRNAATELFGPGTYDALREQVTSPEANALFA